jgi:hypothetical protein
MLDAWCRGKGQLRSVVDFKPAAALQSKRFNVGDQKQSQRGPYGMHHTQASRTRCHNVVKLLSTATWQPGPSRRDSGKVEWQKLAGAFALLQGRNIASVHSLLPCLQLLCKLRTQYCLFARM